MTQVATSIGAPRIAHGISVLHPTGDPALPQDAERATRLAVVREALKVMMSDCG